MKAHKIMQSGPGTNLPSIFAVGMLSPLSLMYTESAVMIPLPAACEWSNRPHGFDSAYVSAVYPPLRV